MTKAWLTAATTYEVLALEEPVARLITRFLLSRRDLELGVALAALLPAVPGARERELLPGGTSQN